MCTRPNLLTVIVKPKIACRCRLFKTTMIVIKIISVSFEPRSEVQIKFTIIGVTDTTREVPSIEFTNLIYLEMPTF